ncbi:hypothetical protein Y032_0059g2963 [Ancylostoma ceylanicum]|uniref:Uncharacterized protein n=1 Tax=Ancylostoma ceylanicum TaxID=53326 RepID=A0A016U3C3_9BILA|nr:hypothetical protein Y032_0059g2963 [Ancylostoma ceylanicum]
MHMYAKFGPDRLTLRDFYKGHTYIHTYTHIHTHAHTFYFIYIQTSGAIGETSILEKLNKWIHPIHPLVFLSGSRPQFSLQTLWKSMQREIENLPYLSYPADSSPTDDHKFKRPAERLPLDFSELLRLLTLCNGRKAVCTSNRRKEAFSMLSLLHGIILAGKDLISVAEAFQLHAQTIENIRKFEKQTFCKVQTCSHCNLLPGEFELTLLLFTFLLTDSSLLYPLGHPSSYPLTLFGC